MHFFEILALTFFFIFSMKQNSQPTSSKIAKKVNVCQSKAEASAIKRPSIKPCGFRLNLEYFQEFIMFQQGRMSADLQENSKKYDTISLQNRKTLVRLVVDQERSISKSARKLGIKLSTAKLIIKKYKESGTFFERKTDRINRQKIQLKLQEENRDDASGVANNALPLDSLSPSQLVYSTEAAPSFHFTTINEQPVYLFNFYPPQMYWM